MTVLVLNTGSSSIKFAAYDAPGQEPVLRGNLSGIGQGRAVLKLAPEALAIAAVVPELDDFGLLHWLLGQLRDRFPDVAAVGHRIVHGGRHFGAPVVLDATAMQELHALAPLAPLHMPHNLAGVAAAGKVWPEARQVGCFDTAFHRSQPEIAQRFAIPRDLHEAGVQRYGFHGLSYQFIADSLAGKIDETARVVVAHLGNGASLCAMQGGKSMATTMGMTALDGLMMGTRSGAIDPGVLLYLMESQGYSTADVSDLLYNRSGLLGVSGISGDVRRLEASGDPAAAQALALFARTARQAIAAMAASIGGLDILVFTGGIGENSVRMRADICEGLGWMGVAVDPVANAANAVQIGGAAVQVLVLPTDEERVIAAAVLGLAES
ncbi:MAG: acetate/propionate family kinase [Cypionkella sp.]